MYVLWVFCGADTRAAVGYYTVWFVWCFEIMLLPISYPISKILDLVLGREIGTIYSKAEVRSAPRHLFWLRKRWRAGGEPALVWNYF